MVSDYYYFGSELTIKDNANVVVNYAKNGGFFVQDNAQVTLTSSSASLKVYNRCFFGGCSTRLTKGTIEIIDGHFYQDDTYSDRSFSPDNAFNVKLTGTNSVQRYVYFETPAGSCFTNISCSGVTFDPDSLISVAKTLTESAVLNCNNATVCLQGDLNGKQWTVTSHTVTIKGYTILNINKGTLTVNGHFSLDIDSHLIMGSSADKVVVNGNFDSVTSNSSTMNNGSLTINGNFNHSADYGFQPGMNLKTTIQGTNRMITFINPAYSYFTNFSLAKGASINPASVISIRMNLDSDKVWMFSSLYYRGNLNGHSLTTGNLVVPIDYSETPFNINKGVLHVMGDMTVQGYIIMTNTSDRVIVSGNFSAEGSHRFDSLTSGRLYIGGNFTQNGDIDCFGAEGNHTTIFNGKGPQSVSFEWNDNFESKFAHVIILNDKMSPSAIPAGHYTDLVVSGETFSGIAVDTGSKLIPAFNAAKSDYMVILPASASSVTVTPHLLDKYGASAWMTEGTGTAHITSVTMTGVSPYNTVTKTIVVHAWNNMETRTYTIKAEKANPYLRNLGVLPAGYAAAPSFDKAVTEYTVQLPETAASFVWAPILANPDSRLVVYGDGQTPGTATSATISLTPGASKTYDVTVTAQDNATKKTYKVTFTRRQPLTGISVSAGSLTPAFSKDTAAYVVNLPATASSIIVTAAKNTSDCSKVEINGKVQPNDRLAVSLTPGCTVAVTIKAWDKDGKSCSTYTVTVKNIAALTGIKLSTGMLSPVFSPAIHMYSVSVPDSTASVIITPVITAGQTVTINGKPVTSVTLTPPSGGSATATIVCTYMGITQTYSVSVHRS